MPYRDFDTAFWADPFIQGLPKDAKMLYLYLWTNEHCTPAGLYEITVKTIAFETGLAEDDIPGLFTLLENKAKWYAEANLVWVKAFIKRQARSSKFLQAAAKALTAIQHNDAVHELIDYNASKYRISIPYQYYMDRVGIPLWSAAAAVAVSVADTESDAGKVLFSGDLFSSELQLLLAEMPSGVDKLAQHEAIKQRVANFGTAKGYVVRSEYAVPGGRVDLCWLTQQGEVIAGFEIDYRTPRDKSLEKLRLLRCRYAYVLLRKGGLRFIPVEQIPGKIETGEAIPPSKSENGENLSEGDREVISTWCSVKGFKMAPSDASELVVRLRKEFTGVDILTQSKKWAARKLSEPLTKKSRPSQQIWSWMEKEREFAEERRAGGKYQGHPGADTKPYEWQETPVEPDDTS